MNTLQQPLLTKAQTRLAAYKFAAATKGRAFQITDEFAIGLFASACEYCGLQEAGQINGIDRVNNRLGYIPGNVVACCSFCNRIKGTASAKKFRAWIAQIQAPEMRRLSVGRPILERSCAGCGRRFGAREMRKHRSECSNKWIHRRQAHGI